MMGGEEVHICSWCEIRLKVSLCNRLPGKGCRYSVVRVTDVYATRLQQLRCKPSGLLGTVQLVMALASVKRAQRRNLCCTVRPRTFGTLSLLLSRAREPVVSTWVECGGTSSEQCTAIAPSLANPGAQSGMPTSAWASLSSRARPCPQWDSRRVGVRSLPQRSLLFASVQLQQTHERAG